MAGAYHARTRARSRTRGDLSRAGGYMRRLQLGMTALALSLMGLFLLKFVDHEGKPVSVHLVAEPSQPRVPPAEAGVDPAALGAAAEFAGAHGTRALVVG